jgi:hypothetical protein
MTAFYIHLSKTSSDGNSANFKYGPIDVGMSYSINHTIDAGLLLNFSTDNYTVEFGVNATFSGSAHAKIFKVGIDASLNASAHARLKGGYSQSDGLFVQGELGGSFEASVGTCYAKCNTVCLEADWFSVDAGAKACVSFSVSAGWSRRNGFNLSSASGN